MQKLDNVNDSSGIVVKIDFVDESGNAVVPNSATWTLTDGNGEIINSREDVTITPEATVYITLTSDDTAYADGKKRVLIAEGEYTSSLTGGTVQVKEGCWFNIDDLPTV